MFELWWPVARNSVTELCFLISSYWFISLELEMKRNGRAKIRREQKQPMFIGLVFGVGLRVGFGVGFRNLPMSTWWRPPRRRRFLTNTTKILKKRKEKKRKKNNKRKLYIWINQLATFQRRHRPMSHANQASNSSWNEFSPAPPES